MLAAVMSTAVSTFNTWISGSVNPVYAQNNGGNQTIVVDELTSNLTRAKQALEGGNSTQATVLLTSVIGELDDILSRMTSEDGPYMDEHTHFFTDGDHVHTVTHKHSHNTNHHHHGDDWTDRHHNFNPKDCKPGLLC
jgi:hypothetical protein